MGYQTWGVQIARKEPPLSGGSLCFQSMPGGTIEVPGARQVSQESCCKPPPLPTVP